VVYNIFTCIVLKIFVFIQDMLHIAVRSNKRQCVSVSVYNFFFEVSTIHDYCFPITDCHVNVQVELRHNVTVTQPYS
jgi:hypothetical protein